MAPKLTQLEDALRLLLDARLGDDTLSVTDTMGILLELAKCENDAQLRETVADLAKQFPCLDEVL